MNPTLRLSRPRRALFLGMLGASLLGVAGGAHPTGALAGSSLPPIRHVWIIMLENESDASAFEGTQNSYLPSLRDAGAYIPGYFGVAHQSLPNYIALLSGQGPNPDTQSDCQVYQDVSPGSPTDGTWGQTSASSGCVYPAGTRTFPDQLSAAGYTWKGYMEDMGQDSGRDTPMTCPNPMSPRQDTTQSAEKPMSSNGNQGDQYAARHDPFMYFHSIIDKPVCGADVVRLQDPNTGLLHDLASASTTPNFSWITPNLCDDGHDPSGNTQTSCAAPDAGGKSTVGGLTAIDDFLAIYVPKIVHSPAFAKDGMLVITFDESHFDGTPNSDSTSCCNEQAGMNTASAGVTGAGGGQVGAVVLSPYVRPGTKETTRQYNHYSLLSTFEDLFQLTGGHDGHGHIGFAAYESGTYPGPCDTQVKPCQPSFGADVFTDPSGRSQPLAVLPPPPITLPSPGGSPTSPQRGGSSGSGNSAAGASGQDAAYAGSPSPAAATASPQPSAEATLGDLRRSGLLGPALASPATPFGLISILLIAPLAAMAGATLVIRRKRAS